MRALQFAARAGCLAVLAWAGRAGAETLPDAIALAYQTNPTLQAERAQLRATDEEYPQAAAGLRPTVSAQGSYNYQDQTISQTGSPNVKAAGGTGSGVVTVTQPIYTGGLVTARLGAAESDVLAERETLRRIEIGVLQSVIGAYLDVRRDTEQTAIAQDNADVLARQLAETTAKFDAGLLTRTDVAQSQARLSLAKAQLATAQSALAQARAAYQAVVGQSPGELAPAPPIEPLLPANVDAAFDLADRDNPQLRQATYAEAASGARLAEAKAQTRPTVSVSGQYGYVGVQQGLSASGISGSANVMESEIGASVTANVNIPIFTGGLTSSQIRQAAELDTVSRIGIETARRQVLQTVAQAWNQLLGARANVAADEVQTQSDTVAFDGVRQEQKVGLRTVLDVLNAENELAQSRLALVGARHDEYVAAAAVLAATGALDAAALVPGTPRYDPKAHFERVRHAVGWVPWEGAVGALDRLGSPRNPSAPSASDDAEVVRTGTP